MQSSHNLSLRDYCPLINSALEERMESVRVKKEPADVAEEDIIKQGRKRTLGDFAFSDSDDDSDNYVIPLKFHKEKLAKYEKKIKRLCVANSSLQAKYDALNKRFRKTINLNIKYQSQFFQALLSKIRDHTDQPSVPATNSPTSVNDIPSSINQPLLSKSIADQPSVPATNSFTFVNNIPSSINQPLLSNSITDQPSVPALNSSKTVNHIPSSINQVFVSKPVPQPSQPVDQSNSPEIEATQKLSNLSESVASLEELESPMEKSGIPEKKFKDDPKFLTQDEILKAIYRVKSGPKGDSMYVKNLAVALFGTETLMSSSITGIKCNSIKESVAKPPLNPEKMVYLRELLRYRILEEKGETKYEDIQKRLKQINPYVADKIATLNRYKRHE